MQHRSMVAVKIGQNHKLPFAAHISKQEIVILYTSLIIKTNHNAFAQQSDNKGVLCVVKHKKLLKVSDLISRNIANFAYKIGISCLEIVMVAKQISHDAGASWRSCVFPARA